MNGMVYIINQSMFVKNQVDVTLDLDHGVVDGLGKSECSDQFEREGAG
jgi:hypothetical protein